MFKSFLPSVTAAVALLLVPGVASAHTKLVGSTPAANSTVSKVTSVNLQFNEKVIASTVKAELVMTGMPGMASHQPMPITGFRTMVTDKTVLVTLPRPLPAGSYQLRWHAVAADQHRVEGSYSFTVR